MAGKKIYTAQAFLTSPPQLDFPVWQNERWRGRDWYTILSSYDQKQAMRTAKQYEGYGLRVQVIEQTQVK